MLIREREVLPWRKFKESSNLPLDKKLFKLNPILVIKFKNKFFQV